MYGMLNVARYDIIPSKRVVLERIVLCLAGQNG